MGGYAEGASVVVDDTVLGVLGWGVNVLGMHAVD